MRLPTDRCSPKIKYRPLNFRFESTAKRIFIHLIFGEHLSPYQIRLFWFNEHDGVANPKSHAALNALQL